MKRFLAVFLCLLMVLSMMPLSAFAEEAIETEPVAEELAEPSTEPEEEIIEETQEQLEAKTLASFESELQTSEGAVASVTVGSSVSYYSDFSEAISAAVSGSIVESEVVPVTITLLDSVELSNRLQLREKDNTKDSNLYVFTLDLGSYNLTYNGTNSGAFILGTKATLNITGSGIFDTNAKQLLSIASKDNVVNIYGGTFKTTHKNLFYCNSKAPTVNIFGGFIDAQSFESFGADAEVKITGGTFSFDPTNYGVNPAYEATKNEATGTWTVTEKQEVTYVASVKIGDGEETTHTTFADAVTKAREAGTTAVTITLLNDCTADSRIALRNDSDDKTARKITIDLGGKTLTSNAANGAFLVAKNSELTIVDSTSNSGKISFSNASDSVSIIAANGGSYVYIKGGTFEGANLILNSSTTGSVTITGGTFPSECDPTSYVDTTVYDVTKDETAGTWTVTEKPEVLDVVEVTIDGGTTTAYKSIVAAYKALPTEGEATATIKLLGDVEVSEELVNEIPLTFDLNGKTVTLNPDGDANKNKRVFHPAKSLTITDSSDEGTGCVDASTYGTKDTHYIAYVNSNVTLTLCGGNYMSACSSKNFGAGSNAVVNLNTDIRSWFNNPLSDIDTVDGETKEKKISTYAAKVTEESHSNCPYTYTDTFATIIYNVNGGVTDEDYVPEKQDELTYLDGFTVNHDLRIQQPINTTNNLVFGSWNTKADGSGSTFTSSIGITGDMLSSGTITLYAQWKTTEDFVAKIGDTQYASLAQAVYAADGITGVDDVTIELTSDVIDKVKVVSGNSVTIDLMGYDISGQEGVLGSTITVAEGGKLTLKDSSDNPGTISGNAQTSGGAIDNSGTLTINDVNITGIAKRNGGGLCSSGTVTMNSGSIDGTVGRSDSTTIYGGGGVYINGGTFTMNGGTIDGTAKPNPDNAEIIPYGGGAVYVSGGTFEMTGGTVKGTITNANAKQPVSTSFYVTSDSSSVLNINGEAAYVDGGIYKGVSGKVEISQGQFKIEPSGDYIPTWSECTESKEAEAEYKYFVDYRDLVIQTTSRISGTNRTIAAVTGGGSYTHAEDVTITAPVVKGFTFNGWYKDYGKNTQEKITEINPYVFNPTDDLNLCAVYDPYASQTFTLSVTGSEFIVRINSGEEVKYINTYKSTLNASDSVLVCFGVDTTQKFMYWTNESGKVVSTVEGYSFVMGSDVTLTAESYTDSSGASAKVIFKSAYGQIMSAQTCDKDTEITIPSGPSKLGYTFTKWKFVGDDETDVTEENIKSKISASDGVINIEPVYEDAKETYKITVKYSDSIKDDDSYEGIIIGQSHKVEAQKSIDKGEGESATTYNFLYWSDKETNGGVLSYETEYYVRALEDVTIYAIYSKDVETVTKDVCINITGNAPTESGRYTITEYYNLPEGYKLVKVGYVYTTNSQLGTETGLILGNDGIKNSVSSLTDNEGIYALNMNFKKDVSKTVYVRGYVQYTKPDDNKVYIMYTGIETVTPNQQ